MSPEAIRIAIAKECGTLTCPGCSWELLECWAHDHKAPDYLNDLNAALVFVEHLRERGFLIQAQNFKSGAWEIIMDGGSVVGTDLPAMFCEVGLKALGKWDDSK